MSENATEEVERELLDMDLLSRSINGFEQIAIRQMFREKLDELAQDGTMFQRALVFVVKKREGMNDGDAFRAAMHMTIEDVVGQFDMTETGETEDAEVIAERDRAYANFVIGTGLSYTFEQYMQLTLSQRDALITEANKRER